MSKIWDSRKFNALSPEGKILLFYNLTSKHATPFLLYIEGEGSQQDATRLSRRKFLSAKRELISTGLVKTCQKLAPISDKFLFFPTGLKHEENAPNSENGVINWVKLFKELPQTPFLVECVDEWVELAPTLPNTKPYNLIRDFIRRAKTHTEAHRRMIGNAVLDAVGDGVHDAVTNDVGQGVHDDVQTPYPRRERESKNKSKSKKKKPTLRVGKEKETGDASKRKSKIPLLTMEQSKAALEAYQVSEQIVTWATTHDMPNPHDWIEEFKDYWRQVHDATAIKSDWEAAFRNRLRHIKAHPNRFPHEAERQRESEMKKLSEVSA